MGGLSPRPLLAASFALQRAWCGELDAMDGPIVDALAAGEAASVQEHLSDTSSKLAPLLPSPNSQLSTPPAIHSPPPSVSQPSLPSLLPFPPPLASLPVTLPPSAKPLRPPPKPPSLPEPPSSPKPPSRPEPPASPTPPMLSPTTSVRLAALVEEAVTFIMMCMRFLPYIGAALVIGVTLVALMLQLSATSDETRFQQLSDDGEGGLAHSGVLASSPSSRASTARSIFSEASKGWSKDNPGWTRSTIRNLNIDLEEELRIRTSAKMRPSPRASSRRVFYRGPRRFRVVDCADLIAFASCLCVLSLALMLLLWVFPPPFKWAQTIDLLRSSK